MTIKNRPPFLQYFSIVLRVAVGTFFAALLIQCLPSVYAGEGIPFNKEKLALGLQMPLFGTAFSFFFGRKAFFPDSQTAQFHIFVMEAFPFPGVFCLDR